VLNLSSVDAGGGYMIFGLPPSETSIHQSDGDIPHHELYFLTDDIAAFAASMAEQNIDCGPVQDQSWGRIVKVTLPSAAPLHVYEPRHARPAEG
jgi:hypothetical protein